MRVSKILEISQSKHRIQRKTAAPTFFVQWNVLPDHFFALFWPLISHFWAIFGPCGLPTSSALRDPFRSSDRVARGVKILAMDQSTFWKNLPDDTWTFSHLGGSNPWGTSRIKHLLAHHSSSLLYAQPGDVLGAALQVVATVEYLLANGVSVRAFAFAVRCLKADNVPEAEWLSKVRFCMTQKIAYLNGFDLLKYNLTALPPPVTPSLSDQADNKYQELWESKPSRDKRQHRQRKLSCGWLPLRSEILWTFVSLPQVFQKEGRETNT